MQSLLRSWLVWLMVLAVPLQGLAGTALQHCATAAQPSAQQIAQSAQRSTAEVVHADHARAQSSVDGGHGYRHGHGHVHGPAADSSGAVATEPASVPAIDGDHQCSACAACCSSLGLPTWAVPLTAPTTASAAAPLSRVAVDSFVPAGLDRPPRSRLG
jgi:hypothetical protein